jgi:hypothetical protein
MKVNFVQFSRGRVGRTSGASTNPMEDVMNTLTKLTLTAALGALIVAAPVSINLVRPNAGQATTAHLAVTLNAAQARGLRSGNMGHGNLGIVQGQSIGGGGGNAGVVKSAPALRDGTLIRRQGVGDSNYWITASEGR